MACSCRGLSLPRWPYSWAAFRLFAGLWSFTSCLPLLGPAPPPFVVLVACPLGASALPAARAPARPFLSRFVFAQRHVSFSWRCPTCACRPALGAHGSGGRSAGRHPRHARARRGAQRIGGLDTHGFLSCIVFTGSLSCGTLRVSFVSASPQESAAPGLSASWLRRSQQRHGSDQWLGRQEQPDRPHQPFLPARVLGVVPACCDGPSARRRSWSWTSRLCSSGSQLT